MTIDPDIRDQAYQFFIEEASELLEIIETGLLNLRPDVTVQKVHEIMRAAHSIKGGAASVDLSIIKTIAHRLEASFKALYSDKVVVDSDLETLLLRAYDCLRHPLQAQIDTGTFNEKQSLAAFESIFSQLEERLGPALNTTDNFMPSAADLGVDIVTSIFEVDIAEVLVQLQNILTNPQDYDCNQELKTQLEVLTGLAELIDLPRFLEITTTAQIAANKHFHQPLPIIEQLISDVDRVRTAILAGDKITFDGPSNILLALANADIITPDTPPSHNVSDQIDDSDLFDINLDILDKAINDEMDEPLAKLSSERTAEQVSTLEEIWFIDAIEFPSVEKIDDELTSESPISNVDSNIDTLADVWGESASTAANLEAEVPDSDQSMKDAASEPMVEHLPNPAFTESLDQEDTNHIESTVNLVGEIYDSLPRLPEQEQQKEETDPQKKKKKPAKLTQKSRLSAKVALDRLERMDNLVGELSINRNSLSLQNDQFQRTVRQLRKRFSSFRTIIKQLQSIADQILVSPNQQSSREIFDSANTTFDSLEMDSYDEISSLLEGILEEVFQLAESIDDVALFAGQSDQLLERQRLTLTQLRDELMWSRMVPLERVLKRFPRVIRELSTSYQKAVQLKLTGTDVLVDRVMLEKLYDPLLHLLRNAFDHGIESPDIRHNLNKPKQGRIEIRAYHQGNYTVIEIEDDGRGLDLDKITQQAIASQLLSPEQVTTLPKQYIQQLIFEPGFSTASEVSELSGRGVGLDIVKESVQTFNGKLSLTSNQGKGTIFSLKIPLTLTLTKLVIGSVGTIAIAIASDSIEEILRPANEQIKQSAGKHFLHWKSQLIPVYKLNDLLSYQCLPPKKLSQELQTNSRPKGEQQTMLIIQQGQEIFALSLEQIVTEQELVIKPIGKSIAAPSYINGCTVLADGRLVPVIDGMALVQFDPAPFISRPVPQIQNGQSHTLMIIDDSSALRRTLALTLRKAGYQVLQAKDGRDALDQLQRGTMPDLIICDVEMPRLNGFEFLSQRRTNPLWSEIPTVMLTSRGNYKHRTLANHLGATDYFTKPYIEKEFLGVIANLLQQKP